MPTQKFYPFPESNTDEWMEQIRKDLKGKVDESTLITTLWEEIKINPIYGKEQLKKEPIPYKFNFSSKFPGLPPRIWSNLILPVLSDEKSINAEILASLQLGAEGIILRLEGHEDLNQILKGVFTEHIQLYFSPLAEAKPVLIQVKNWVESMKLTPEMLHGSILWSPTGEFLKGKTNWQEQIENGIQVLSAFKLFPNFYPITISFAHYANAGATGIQELTYGLGELIDILDQFEKNGISVKDALSQFAFHTAVGENHFPEIAKLKVLRNLLVDLAENLGGELTQEKIHLITSTSTWNKSIFDQNTSLVRQTYEAMAGILGGCNALWVRTIQEENPDELTKRIARNISTILREESFLDKVMDPSSGAYFLENLQSEIEQKVLFHLDELEKSGGWKVSFLKGSIESQVNLTATKTQESILKKEKILVGVNKYQLKQEPLTDTELSKEIHDHYDSKQGRASYLVELEKLKKA